MTATREDKSCTVRSLFMDSIMHWTTLFYQGLTNSVSFQEDECAQTITVSVCGCRDNVIQNSTAYIFPCIYIFNMSQNITYLERAFWGFFAFFNTSRISFMSHWDYSAFSVYWKISQPCEERQCDLVLFSTVYFVSMSPSDYCAVVCILTPHIGWLHCR